MKYLDVFRSLTRKHKPTYLDSIFAVYTVGKGRYETYIIEGVRILGRRSFAVYYSAVYFFWLLLKYSTFMSELPIINASGNYTW